MAMLDSNYIQIALGLFDDLMLLVPEYTHSERNADASYYSKRLECEGVAFVSKTLPALCKHLELALEEGTFHPFPALRREPGRPTPSFLRAAFKGIFDEEGLLRENPDTRCIRAIRQVGYLFYKIEGDYDQAVVDEFLAEFRRVDVELGKLEFDIKSDSILRIAQNLVGYIFRDFCPRDIFPRPGPGASATRTHRNHRFEPVTRYEQIADVYPYSSTFYLGTMHLADRIRTYRALPRKRAGTSMVRLVPKDSRGPRIICMEPQEYMFLQQGLGDAIRKHLERHPVTRGRVNFRDQLVNRGLALRSSVDRRYSTLDMKDASDRISRKLVSTLFDRVPHVKRALLALSTPEAELPNGSVVELEKFAPMGSSLCFPIMSTVHYVLGLAVLYSKYPAETRRIVKDSLYVYGDDIICRSEYAAHLFEEFPRYGLKFNQSKSFVKGHFRESCGMDAYKGVSVTPQRIKRRFYDTLNTASIPKDEPKDRRKASRRPVVNPDEFLAAADFEFNLRSGGYPRAAATIRASFEAVYGSFPTVFPAEDVIGWKTDTPSEVDVTCLRRAWHRPTQNYRVTVQKIVRLPDSSMVGGWERLVKCLTLSPEDSKRVEDRFSRAIVRVGRVPLISLLASQSKKWDNAR